MSTPEEDQSAASAVAVADTATDDPAELADRPEIAAGDHVTLTGFSMVVLRRSAPTEP